MAGGLGLTRRVKVALGRDRTIEWAVIPDQKLMSRTPFAHNKPPHEESGPARLRTRLVYVGRRVPVSSGTLFHRRPTCGLQS